MSHEPVIERQELKKLLTNTLLHNFSVQPENATDEHFYHALATILRDIMQS